MNGFTPHQVKMILGYLNKSPAAKTIEEVWLSGCNLDAASGHQIAILIDSSPKLRWLNVHGQPGREAGK